MIQYHSQLLHNFLNMDFKKVANNWLLLQKNQNKKHAKVQNFMLIDSKILSLHPLIFY